ncbi:hypothetical protein CP965_13150 [Halarcobacter mediterraneus]|uniref:diguanylate cyclase n=1 Tax=Halarcobacter mediterraneus TaxID=2023153 RepID=A0A4Q1AW79_9BACT|nr:diguanylate cyclase [Halarcobacter mediterraneus]RXK11709.1 hypothetical protein CP965_13150 [Halarcobacter mediterraneus]
MSINKKVSLLFSTVFIIFFIIISLFINYRVQNIEKLENKIIINNIRKVQSLLDNYYEKLENIGYEYSADSNILYDLENKNTSTKVFSEKIDYMKRLDISYFIVFNKHRDILYGKYYDISSGEYLPISSELLTFIKNTPIKTILNKNNRYLTIDYEKVLFHFEKVIYKGKVQGYLLIGRTIDSNFLTSISEVVEDYSSLISNYGLNSFDILNYKDSEISYTIKKIENNRLFYYIKFKDLVESNNFFIRLINDREVYTNMIYELKIILLLFILMFLLMLIIFFIFMNKLFINRIKYITSIIKRVSLSESLNYSLNIKYNDEISYLMKKINEMFRVINTQHKVALKKEIDKNNRNKSITLDTKKIVADKSTISNLLKKWLASNDFSIVLFEIDYFNKIDNINEFNLKELLKKELLEVISSEISKKDILGSFDEEKFIVLIDEKSSLNVLNIANRIRKLIEKKIFFIEGKRVFITLSMGCTICMKNESIENIYERLNEALLEAKRSGRNKVVFN